MNRTTLLTAALAIAVVFAAASPALGMRDPGPGGMYGPMPPRVGQAGVGGQYGDGMNLYQYVRSNPVVLVDPQGLWSWRNSNDVYVIQTILNNNAKRFGLDLGSYGPGGNGIDGKYGSKTKAAVCKFQQELNNVGCNVGAADGLWGAKTTAGFEQCENANKVNWRYAHLRLGAFVGVHGITPWAGGGAYGGAHACLREKTTVDWNWGALTFTTTDTTGGHAGGDIYVALAWGIFNAEDWRSLGNTQGEWGASLGPLKDKLGKILGKGGKVGLDVITTIVENKGNIEAAITAIQTGVGDAIWKGTPGSAVFSYGIGLGGFKTLQTTNYHTTDFAIGN